MAYVSYGRLIKNTVDINQETMRLVFKDYFFPNQSAIFSL